MSIILCAIVFELVTGSNSNQHIQNVNKHKATSVLNDTDLTETMSTIHEKYAVLPADKTCNNIVL